MVGGIYRGGGKDDYPGSHSKTLDGGGRLMGRRLKGNVGSNPTRLPGV